MVYQTIYDLIMSALFAGATATEWVALVVTILATTVTVFVFAIPFIVVWKIIRLFIG